MGKAIDLSAITAGLAKAKSLAASLDTIAREESVEPEYIHPAAYNPYAENDTPEELEALAKDIQVNGLIHPLVVNKQDDTHFTLISGEKRLKAISQYLGWKTIPCRVYRNLSADRAQLMLHSANLRARDYSNEQKLRFFADAEALLKRMKETGEYSGPLQRGIAELLQVSTRQVRRYQLLMGALDAGQVQEIAEGKMSMRSALRKIAKKRSERRERPEQESLEDLPQNGQPEAVAETAKDTEKGNTVKYTLLKAENLFSEEWEPILKGLLGMLYDLPKLYQYYTFFAPTPEEAVGEMLRIQSHLHGTLPGGQGKYQAGLTCVEIYQIDGDPVVVTYKQLDSLIRRQLRGGVFLPAEVTAALLREYLESKSGHMSAFSLN